MYSKLYSICLCLILFIIYIFLDKQKKYEGLQDYKDYEDISNCLSYSTMYHDLTNNGNNELSGYLEKKSGYIQAYFKSNMDSSDVALDFAYFNNSANIQAGYNLYQ